MKNKDNKKIIEILKSVLWEWNFEDILYREEMEEGEVIIPMPVFSSSFNKDVDSAILKIGELTKELEIPLAKGVSLYVGCHVLDLLGKDDFVVADFMKKNGLKVNHDSILQMYDYNQVELDERLKIVNYIKKMQKILR